MRIFLAALIILFCANPAQAQDEISAEEFLKSVGCSFLPLGACEVLDAENARNIIATHRAILLMRTCGISNVTGAKHLLENGDADKPAECKRLLQLLDK